MAAPAFRSTATTYLASGASINATKPASVAVGDLLVLAATTRNATSDVSTPAGWTLHSVHTLALGSRSALFTRVADGTEGATLSVTTADALGTVTFLVGYTAYISATVDVYDSSTGALTPAVCPSVTTTVSDTRLVILVLGRAVAAAGTPPGSFTERFDTPGSDTRAWIWEADLAQAAIGATGTFSVTCADTSASWSTHTLAIATAVPTLAAPFIAATTTVYAPTLAGTGTATLAAPFIADATTVYTATVGLTDQVLDVPFVAATSTVYAPTLARSGIGAQPLGVSIALDDPTLEAAPTWTRIDG